LLASLSVAYSWVEAHPVRAHAPAVPGVSTPKV
jgi:hypothetical protein